MTTAEFLKYLNKEVGTYQKKYRLTEGKAFGMWVATEYLSIDETDAFEAVSDAARQFNFDAVNNIPSQLAKLMGLEFLRTLHEESISQSTRVGSCSIRLSNFFEESGAYGKAIVTTI